MKRLLLLSAIVCFFNSCISDENHEGVKVLYEEIFPIQSMENRWYLSDNSGNELSIQVVDTVFDGGDEYYKIVLNETLAPAAQVHWILKTSDEFLLGNSLRGSFSALLPKRLKESGGSFDCAGSEVDYAVYDSYLIESGRVNDVVELHYKGSVFNGFSSIAFANKMGPIRFVDDSGRWPVQYDLDSAFVNGTVIDLTK